MPPSGFGASSSSVAAQLALLLAEPAGNEERAGAEERNRDVGGEGEGELARFGEGEVGQEDEDERDRRRADGDSVDRPAALRHPDQDDPGEEGGGNRAGEGAGRGRGEGELVAANLQAAQRGQATGDAEGEGELAVGEQRDHAGGEPEGRPAGGRAPAVADEAIEEVGGGDDRDRPDLLRPQQ